MKLMFKTIDIFKVVRFIVKCHHIRYTSKSISNLDTPNTQTSFDIPRDESVFISKKFQRNSLYLFRV